MHFKPILIPEDRHFKLRERAASLGIKIQHAATEAIDAWLRKPKKNGKR